MNLSIDQVRDAILFLIALVLSVSVHEFGHAWVATLLGDPLPKSQGRLSLSPTRHVDPMGTLAIPLIMQLSGVGLLGWGKPVLTNPSAYTPRLSRATGNLLVSLAGPTMNLLLASLVSLLVIVGGRMGWMSFDMAVALMRHLVALNFTLLFFNLLPIPPLDGGSILAWLLPGSLAPVMKFLNRYGFLILLGLMLTGMIGRVMAPAYQLSQLWMDAVMRGAAP